MNVNMIWNCAHEGNEHEAEILQCLKVSETVIADIKDIIDYKRGDGKNDH